MRLWISLSILWFVTITVLINDRAVAQNHPWYDSNRSFDERISLLINEMTLEEKLSQLNSNAPAIDRLGVPQYNWWNEALHGVARNGKATIFPQAIALAATFDPELAKRVGDAISTEARAKYTIAQSIENRGKYAGLTFWSPNVNIFRDSRWGRGQETYGEDPYLTSKMGVAFVQGIQGNNPKYLKAAACAKHYAVHSGPESLRHHFDVIPSKRDLYETYLPSFEALVKNSSVAGVMGAYNAVYGDPACASDFLINDILKDRWGFDGYIVSDCGALGDILNGHKKVNTPEEAAALALKTGVNLNCGYTYSSLKNAYDQGLVSDDLINERLAQLFKIRFKLGLFDPQNPFSRTNPSQINSTKNIALAKEVAQKSIVLLKNDNNTLPLKKDIKNLYVTGPFAASVDVMMANYYGVTSNVVTVLEGIADKVSLGTSLNYRMGALPFQKNINAKNWAPFVAGEVEATICVLGISADMEGEEVDAIASANMGDRIDLKLPQNQIDYFNELSKKKKGPLILVIASGSPVSLQGLEEQADAILQMWYPGEQGGSALADIIFGDIAPSGHLPITFPKSVDDLPLYEDYSMKGRTYKYMEKEPLYPFGYGLTYSKISISEIKSSTLEIKEDQTIDNSFEITNEGNWELEDVIQLYLSPKEAKDLPFYKLLRFDRVKLRKNESLQMTYTLNNEDLKYFDKDGDFTWIKGDFQLSASNALPSDRALELGATKSSDMIIHLK